MNDAAKEFLLQEIESYVVILDEKGVNFDIPSHEELQKYDFLDLRKILRQVKDLARTPTS